MEKKPYQVGATPILLDGDRAEPGDIVDLTDKEAAGLAGYVSPVAVMTTKPVSEPEKPAEQEKPAEPATPKKGAKA